MSEKPIVDFIIIGAQKSGTTSLAEQLAEHPQINFCSEKEPHFFSKEDSRDEKLVVKYHNLYTGHGKAKNTLFGEASTSYSFVDEYPQTAQRIYDYNPQIKLIYMLRDPVARIESHFNHRIRNGRVKHNDPERALNDDAVFIQRSQYARQLTHYLELFPASQIKVILFDDYTVKPEAVVHEVLAFIGASTDIDYQLDTGAKNISDARLRLKHIPFASSLLSFIERIPGAWRFARWLPMKTPIPLKVKQSLFKQLQGDVEELERLTQLDLSVWKEKYNTE